MDSIPILITGMHRSGTSLVSKILMKNGINLGTYQDNNNESIYFQRLNRWIMSCLGSSWDNPSSLKNISNNDLKIIVNRLERNIGNRFTNSVYFGFSNILLNRNFYLYNKPLGWKDPSNVFTAVVWKSIFPNLKIINLTRDPLDVSISLLNRQSALKQSDKTFFVDSISSFIPLLSISKGNILSSFNLSSVDDCLALYKKYLIEMKSNNAIFGPNILNIKYKKLLENPESELMKVYEFCKINPDNIKTIIKDVDCNNLNKYVYENYSYSEDLLDELIIDF